MTKLRLLLTAVLLPLPAFAAQGLAYPATRTVKVADVFHGVKVEDPYRWLEDMKSDEVHAWVLKQNELTRSQLDPLPTRDRIRRRLTELWNYEKYSAPEKRGGLYFYFHNSGLQNQDPVFTTADLKKPGKILLDPNTLSADGTTSLGQTSISGDGKLFAYALSRSGSDWLEWKVRDVATGKDLPDSVLRSKHDAVAWAGAGFYYLKFEENGVNRLYYHRLGAAQAEDAVVFEHPTNKADYVTPVVSEDGRWLIAYVHGGSTRDTMVYYADLKAAGPVKLLPLVDKAAGKFDFLGNIGSRLLFLTSLDAPRSRIVSVDVAAAPPAWKTLIAEGDDVIGDAALAGRRLVLTYVKDASAVLRVFGENGEFLSEPRLPVPLPGISALVARPSDRRVYFNMTGVTAPSSVFSLDPAAGKIAPVWTLKLLFDPSEFEAARVFYPSKDGTKVPMLIARKKTTPLDGTAPALLNGYGGFNNVPLPRFQTRVLQWMEMGGVYAFANIRGGGEYGEAWHQAGIKTRKQNVFDDFIAAAEWLIANKYTSAPKLAITGASNGGLLVGACLVQRPDLFGAALPDVGVMDMLRFQLFTEGAEWTVDYGEIAKADEFKALFAYSPYHNIRSGRAYPPTLITTAETDDRVVPAHSYKFAARLQASQAGPAPILLRVETKAGHGAGTPTAKIIERYVDLWSFLADALKIRY